MFKFDHGNIYLTKGDSVAITLDLTKADGSTYSMASGDKIVMTVRASVGGTVLMTVTSSTKVLDITHTLSSALPVGRCVYDIQLTTGAGDVFTLFGPTDEYSMNMMVYPEITT